MTADACEILRRVDVLDGVPEAEIVYIEATQGPGDLAGTVLEGFGDSGERPLVIGGTKGLGVSVDGFGHDARGFGLGEGFVEDPAEDVGVNFRHVAGEDKVPVGFGVGEGGFDAGEGAATRTDIGVYGESEFRVFVLGSNDGDASGGGQDGIRHDFDHSSPLDFEERLILAHAGTRPSREHKTRSFHDTDDIIRTYTLGGLQPFCLRKGLTRSSATALQPNLNGNKMKKICSIILGWMSVALATASAQTGHVTIVVRPDLQTGKLIRATVVEAKPVTAMPASVHEPLVAAAPVSVGGDIVEMIDRIAAQYEVEAPLVHSVIRAESNYNAMAISNKGALGMMQLIPSTARRFGVQNPFDPRQNVEGGVRYLRFLLNYFSGDYPKAIAAYNAGENAVDRYRGIPPYPETRNYVYQVAKNLKAARQAQEAKLAKAAAPPTPVPAGDGKSEETYNHIRASVSEDGVVSYRTQ